MRFKMMMIQYNSDNGSNLGSIFINRKYKSLILYNICSMERGLKPKLNHLSIF